MAWSTSDRRQRLPIDWERRRRRQLARDRHQCQVPGCPNKATDVDHIDRFAGDDDWNLQSLCGFHHRQKSSQEGHEEQARLRALLKRKPEPHPGEIPASQAVPRQNKGF